MKRYIIFLSVFVCTLFFAGAEVKIDHASIHRSGDSVYVDFTMTVPDRTVGSDYVQRITPVLKNQSDSVALDEIEIVGKRKQKLRRREEVLTGKTYEPVPYQTVNGGEVKYAVVLPYESWMSETPVELSLARECEGCCRVSPLPGIALCREVAVAPPYQPQVKPVPLIPSVAERLAEVEKVLFPMTAYEPYSETMQVWREKGALKVFFPLDKSDLRRDYRDNGETLDKIVDILKQIYADDRSDVGKILIVGFASPEGPTLRNERLAGARAQVLKEYVNRYMQLPDSLYEVANGGEAWGELRDMVEASSFDCKERMLDIIDNTPDPNRREWLLRHLEGGKPFAEMLKSVFTEQRNSGYMRVYYTSVPDSNAIKINQAQQLIEREDYEGAIALLQPIQDDKRSLNTLATAYYRKGDKDQALAIFKQAAEFGDKMAIQNMRNIEND